MMRFSDSNLKKPLWVGTSIAYVVLLFETMARECLCEGILKAWNEWRLPFLPTAKHLGISQGSLRHCKLKPVKKKETSPVDLYCKYLTSEEDLKITSLGAE